jgi:hypothetical protein
MRFVVKAVTIGGGIPGFLGVSATVLRSLLH